MNGMNFAREYHSTPLLMPDGRVVVAGGEGKPGEEHKDTSVVEAFSPPYLFKGIRLEIRNLTQTIFPRASVITFRIANTSMPTSVILMGIEAVTHFTNTGNARYIEIPFTQNGDMIHATLPSDKVEIPLGFYTLFAMTDDIPSVGKIIHITPATNNSAPLPNIEVTKNRINVYPNPFHANTTVSFFLKEQSNVEITLFSILGKKVKHFNLGNIHTGLTSFSIDESKLVPGVYYVQITAENAVYTEKLSVY